MPLCNFINSCWSGIKLSNVLPNYTILLSGYKILEVIQGNADAYVHTTAIKKWDLCAGHAILRAMGGILTSLAAGEDITYSNRQQFKVEQGLLATVNNHDVYLTALQSLKILWALPPRLEGGRETSRHMRPVLVNLLYIDAFFNYSVQIHLWKIGLSIWWMYLDSVPREPLWPRKETLLNHADIFCRECLLKIIR